jgi:hypothetical protein
MAAPTPSQCKALGPQSLTTLEQPAVQAHAQPLTLKFSGWLGIFVLSLAIFLAFGAYQLALPGLQYDEAKEAGLNAMQLVTGQPLTAFRDATVQIGPWRLPLMVQDYIGALNVLLATPFLALGGSSVVALRWLPLLIGAVTLWLAWRLAWRLGGPIAASATVLLLACSPTFIFWSRQGIFVTNLTMCLFLASLWAALLWWDERRPWQLWLVAGLWGLGLYAKLLFLWAIGALTLVGIAAWAAQVWRRPADARRLGPGWAWAVAAACFLLPLVPLILFNLRTGGTLTSIFGNLGHSYYGVDNRAYWPNLMTRLGQLRILLLGDQFWYLGEIYANQLAPWLAGALVLAAAIAGALRRPHSLVALLPVALLALIVAQSAFTVSDLFITHYALLLPLIPLAGGLAVGTLWQVGRDLHIPWARVALPTLAVLALLTWAGNDVSDSLAYHRILTVSGGYGSHSDAIYRLADYLDAQSPSAPLALDWGLDAQLRFLSRGRVNPVEVFGYSPLDQPDPGFAGRIAPFLENPDTLYIAHVPAETVFHGRVEALRAQAAVRGLTVREEARFGLRSGKTLFIVYRVVNGS